MLGAPTFVFFFLSLCIIGAPKTTSAREREKESVSEKVRVYRAKAKERV